MLVSAVAEGDDRLIAEWDRSQNRTAAPLLEHGIGPSLYCSIKKPLVVQCLVARPPGPPYNTDQVSKSGIKKKMDGFVSEGSKNHSAEEAV